jgi:hypothetical protein
MAVLPTLYAATSIPHAPRIHIHTGDNSTAVRPEGHELALRDVATEHDLVVAVRRRVSGVLEAPVVLIAVDERQVIESLVPAGHVESSREHAMVSGAWVLVDHHPGPNHLTSLEANPSEGLVQTHDVGRDVGPEHVQQWQML